MKHWGIAMIAAVLVGCRFTAIADQFGDFTYISDGETVTITGYTGAGGDVTIPESIVGRSVTVIGVGAFDRLDSLVTVTIPDSVSRIEDRAFYSCGNVTALTIGNAVTNIGEYAFSFCGNLGSVTIPESVISIGDFAFDNCEGLTVVNLPESILRIGTWAFNNCRNLASVSIPSGVAEIGENAFINCENLNSIMVAPDSLFYSDLDGVLLNRERTTLIRFPGGRAGDYVIPGSVSTIEGFAFASCHNLTTVTIPFGVTKIGDGEFRSCNSLTAFTVDSDNPFYSDVDGVLFNKEKTKLIRFPVGRSGNYETPENVHAIGDYAFYTCNNLTSVILGRNVESIGNGAFDGCLYLNSVTIPDSVTRIGEKAFNSCAHLTRFVVPGGVTELQYRTFNRCSGLERVYFGGNAPVPDAQIFLGASDVIVYYLPGTTGWGDAFAERPTVLWNPVITYPTPGVGENGFSFQITGTENIPIAVEATDDLFALAWTQLETNTLAGGTLDFEDEDGGSFGNRMYRIAAP